MVIGDYPPPLGLNDACMPFQHGPQLSIYMQSHHFLWMQVDAKAQYALWRSGIGTPSSMLLLLLQCD